MLLKSGVMALPVYSMSCYKLSNSLCNQIERKMAGCWWGDSEGKKKMHWSKWDDLTENKEDGGLAFRDLRSMNEALLAKQVWRMLQEPNLLMSHVLKGKYFPYQEFLQTKQKDKDSWLWKSWLGSQELITKGMS